MTKIVLYDIETTNLAADMGRMVCFSWKYLGEENPIHTFTTYDLRNDSATALYAREVLTDADIIVGHFSSRFDLPFINSRLLAHGMYPVAPVQHIDTWRTARNRLRLQSNRMDNIAEFVNGNRKEKLPKSVWVNLNLGDEDAKQRIVDYCEQDIRTLEDVYLKLRPLMSQHPNVNLRGLDDEGRFRCPACGSSDTHRRGTTVAHAMITQRYHCNSCGKWSRGKPYRPDGVKVEVR